ncbi:MAG TPA: EAL domain-containing protein [Terriglobales bacterium]|nr:EAL domain-containing protein [Terriglobales bacterium]
MKRQMRIPFIPNALIAVTATALGYTIAPNVPLRFLPSSQSFTASYRDSSTILGLTVGLTIMMVFRILTDRQLKLESDLLEAFLEYIPENVYFKDRCSRFIRVNRALATHLGHDDPRQLWKKTDADLFSSEHAAKALKDEQDIICAGQSLLAVEEKETFPDGHEDWVLTTKVPLKDRRGRIIGTMGISHNITERKQAEARIQHMALHDALTGLPNRVLLVDRLSQAISLARRSGKHVAVLMLDLDRFKSVNDSFGHHVGDSLLEVVAIRLKSCLRESDVVARWGGDEFVVVLPEVNQLCGAEMVAEKILTTLAEPFLIESHRLQISASIGICQFPADGENSAGLLEIADAAMYESKKKGRDTYSFFTPELTQATLRRKQLEVDLREACIRGEFILYYQPLVAIDSSCITAVEALLRWHHPELGIISPVEFIPLMEELGLISEAGNWVLKTACIQNVKWKAMGLAPVRVAVNVSAQQFLRGNIVSAVKSALRESGLDPQWLELELTESLTLDDSGTSIAIMQELKQIGVSLSLDDFGTGWSSLSYLRQFPLDRIKIDRSFLRDVGTHSSAEAVVRSILNLGRNLGLSCVAEGVETTEQLTYLKNQKCAEMQGYLYSVPLPADDCSALMLAGSAVATLHGSRGSAKLVREPGVAAVPRSVAMKTLAAEPQGSRSAVLESKARVMAGVDAASRGQETAVDGVSV